MTSKLTRERLAKIKSWRETYGAGSNVMLPSEEAEELACLALAAMDSEPVILYRQVNPVNGMKTYWAELDPEEFRHLKKYTDENAEFMTLYRHAQPAPVVPDDVLKALQKVARIRLDMDGFDGDRRGIADCLCDAEEALIEVVNRRAAMFNHPEQHLDMVDHSGDVNEKGGDGNSPVIPNGWTCNDKANAALMMLDRIETVDPVDDDRIDGIKRIVRELAAAPHDTPALNSIQSVDTVADRWIPVSERMPESNGVYFGWDGKRVLEVNCFFGGFSANQFIHGEITHWMPLPAAPQEVKGE
ncbi:TPA: DUF551 domain-containing protein [Klebsiella pneumoniae]